MARYNGSRDHRTVSGMFEMRCKDSNKEMALLDFGRMFSYNLALLNIPLELMNVMSHLESSGDF
jgi:hypothetical protein